MVKKGNNFKKVIFFLGLCLFSLQFLQALTGVIFYVEKEVKNPEDWFGIWHIKPVFSNLGIEYKQWPIDKISSFTGEADIYLWYQSSDTLSNWKEVYKFFLEAYKKGKKFVLITPPFFKIEGQYNYNQYNKILNFCGIEDRNYWTNKIKDRKLVINDDFFIRSTIPYLKKNIIDFREIKVFRPHIKVLTEKLNSKEGNFIVITDWGAYIYPNFLVVKTDKGWELTLDLEKFFQKVVSFNSSDKKGNIKSEGEEPREFLVLYSSSLEPAPRYTIFYQYLQLPLNWLGYTYRYVDVDREDLTKYVNYPLVCVALKINAYKSNKKIFNFLVKSHARKVIFLGYFPFFNEKGDWIVDKPEFFNKFSFKYEGDSNFSEAERIAGTKKYYPFETEISKSQDFSFMKMTPAGEFREVLKVTTKEGKTYYPIFYNDKALFLVGETYFNWKKNRYTVNLFSLLKDFLSPSVIPLYQKSIGGRIAFCRMDGDGFPSSYFKTPDVICGERIYDFFKKKNFPATISFIGNEILPERDGRLYLLELAKKISELPHIRIASHSFVHPFLWKISDREVKNKMGYTQGKFDYQEEILGSIRKFKSLFGEKMRNLFFWTGDCQPTEEQLKFCWEHGILQINGGDNKKDDGDSYYTAKPPYVLVGDAIQFNNQACNENVYTNLWRSNFGGYVKVIETFQNTFSPYELSPIDIYFHFYSATYKESFEAIKKVFDWVEKQPELSPMWVEEYLYLLQDFLSCKIFKIKNGYKIITKGHLRDIKVKKEKGKYLDLRNSKGILGYRDNKDGYVDIYLDKTSEHNIIFTKRSNKANIYPYFLFSSHYPELVFKDKKIWKYKFLGFGPFSVEVALSKRKKYEIILKNEGGKKLFSKKVYRKSRFSWKGEIKGSIFLDVEEKK